MRIEEKTLRDKMGKIKGVAYIPDICDECGKYDKAIKQNPLQMMDI